MDATVSIWAIGQWVKVLEITLSMNLTILAKAIKVKFLSENDPISSSNLALINQDNFNSFS